RGGQIVIDGGGAAISLGARVETTYDESADGHDGTAVLLRNATDISVESVTAEKGTLQFGTTSDLLAGGIDVTGNVSQTDFSTSGITVRTIAANTIGDITITSDDNDFDQLGLIELNGDLWVRSDSGGLQLTENIRAQSARIETGGSALVIGDSDITATA